MTQFSPASCHFIPPWFKYFPQHPVLKHPQTERFQVLKAAIMKMAVFWVVAPGFLLVVLQRVRCCWWLHY
jgi:hypothetical protein